MSNPNPPPNLNQLIQEAHVGVVKQQEVTASLANQGPKQSKAKPVVGVLALAAFVGVGMVQYPLFSAPLSWPDTESGSVAEANMEAVVEFVETYRFSQGQYPSALNQIQFPDGLAQLIDANKLEYRAIGSGYALDWSLAKWRVRFDSETNKISSEPLGTR